MNSEIDNPARSAEHAVAVAPRTALQGLIWPEQGICTERDLYIRLEAGAGMSGSERAVHFTAGGKASFNTWFNLFNVGKWSRNCALGDLSLSLTGKGRFELTVFLALPERSWERVANEVVTLSGDAPAHLDLSHVFDIPFDEGVLYFEMRALRNGILTDASWHTSDTPRRIPDLMLSITTFKREAAVERTVRRFARFIAESDLKDHIRLTVVDNGKSAKIENGPHVRSVQNENLGGAGGFSRGLIEARNTGATHCLFMDDDASVHMESIERTWTMLAYAIDPATAIAGSMINASHRWAIWENGAVFNTRCIPLHMGVDLRDPIKAFGMEFDTTGPAPANFYGGWWYFAFPVDQVKHMPFPFFVRGDDVSFSLAHDFNILTLPGVVSFQDSFTDKESPLTWYLDLRSHMAHHLSLPSMEIGPLRTYKIAVWFFMRNILRSHYETLSAVNLAVEDVLRGPDFFAENADMAQRRADIKALTHDETWAPLDPSRPADRRWFNPERRLIRLFFKLTLNGQFLPFFRLFGNRITLAAEDRASIRKVWGASRITYLDASKKKAYTVTHSKMKGLKEGWRLFVNGVRFTLRYKALRDQWRDGYARLASDRFWNDALHVDQAVPAAQDANSPTSKAK